MGFMQIEDGPFEYIRSRQDWDYLYALLDLYALLERIESKRPTILRYLYNSTRIPGCQQG